jgi:hypothetical protein
VAKVEAAGKIKNEMSRLKLQVDLDTSTYRCPCGESFTWSGLDDGLSPWLALHAPHADEKEIEETITADGCRATDGSPTTIVRAR